MKSIMIAAALALMGAAPVPQPAQGPSVGVCRVVLAVSVEHKSALAPLVEQASTALGFTAEQKEVQRAVCAVYFAGVADGITLATPTPAIA